MNPLIDFYNQQVKEHGIDSPQALNWQDKNSQQERFRVLAEINNLENRSILDVGCGFGDLYDFLIKEGVSCSYKGIDITPQMIEVARSKHPELDFELVGLSEYAGPRVDYALASGVLSFKTSNHKERYFAYIQKMFDLSKIGVGFNMLNAEHHPDDDTYVAWSISEVQDMCHSLTERVTIVQDYLPRDFTVYLYR